MKNDRKDLSYWLHEYVKYTFFGSDSDELDRLNEYQILAKTYLLSQVVYAMYQTKPIHLTDKLVILKSDWTKLLKEHEISRYELQEFINTMDELIEISKENYQRWKTLN